MVFNAHSDIPSNIYRRRLLGEKDVFRKQHYRQYIEGNVKAAIWVLWTDPAYHDQARDYIHHMYKVLLDEFIEAKDIIKHVRSPKEAKEALNEGKIAIFLGMEGLSHIEDDLSLIDLYYDEWGIRHMGITWNEQNSLASGISNPFGSVSELGKMAIKKINDKGILLDVSHLNEASFWDVLRFSQRPVIASHTNSRKFANIPRNFTDEQIIHLAKHGGIIGINACAQFVCEAEKNRTIDDYIEQIIYIKKLVGTKHICLGFDFCDFLPPSLVGYPDPLLGTISVKGLTSEADCGNLLKRLKYFGFSEQEIYDIAWLNINTMLEDIISK